jgi:hypothetical protein
MPFLNPGERNWIYIDKNKIDTVLRRCLTGAPTIWTTTRPRRSNSRIVHGRRERPWTSYADAVCWGRRVLADGCWIDRRPEEGTDNNWWFGRGAGSRGFTSFLGLTLSACHCRGINFNLLLLPNFYWIDRYSIARMLDSTTMVAKLMHGC